MRWVLVLCLAACGRVAFEPIAASDAVGIADAALDAPVDARADAASEACAASYLPVTGLSSRYRVVASRATWTEAQIACEVDGGRLAVIDSVAEQVWLASQAKEALPLGGKHGWLGLSDHRVEGTFVWLDGSAVTASSWETSEPNDQNGYEDCVEITEDGTWNDIRCVLTFSSVCECDGLPPPTPQTWCDTNLDSDCGTCGNVCSAGTTCVDQSCRLPS